MMAENRNLQLPNLSNLQEIPYQIIAENVFDLIWIVRFVFAPAESEDAASASPFPTDIKFVYATPSVEQILGYTQEEWLQCSLADVLTPDSLNRCFETLRSLMEGEFFHGRLMNQTTLYLDHVRKDGGIVHCEITSVTIRDEQHRPIGALGITRDITQRRAAEDALRNEKRLLQQLLDLQERDRQIWAYEIHDGLTQQMTAALMHFEASRNFVGEDSLRCEVEYERGMKMLRECVGESRRLISGLRPPILDEYGIVAAVEYLVNEARRSGLNVAFASPAAWEELAHPLQSTIFRIVQESLTNARRHSRASDVRVELVRHGDRIQIVVEDNGVGFDVRKVPPDRFGLKGIRERARFLDGTAVISSKSGKGTKIDVDLPAVPQFGNEPEDPSEQR